MKHIIALSIVAILPITALADDAKPAVTEAHGPVTHVFVYGGANVGVDSSSIDRDASGKELGKTNTPAKNAAIFGIEGKRDFPSLPIAASAIFERSPFNYSDGSPGDVGYTVLAMPSAHYDMDALRLWAGVGLGLVITTIGETTSGNLTIPSSATGFSYSLRAGSDYAVGSRFLIGAEVAYTAGSASVDISKQSVVIGSIDATRHWVTLGLRLGVSF